MEARLSHLELREPVVASDIEEADGITRPLDIEEGYFHTEKHRRLAGSVTRTARELARIPGDVVGATIDVVALVRKEARQARVAAYTKNEREALEHVRRQHFAGFKKRYMDFKRFPEGEEEYQLAKMEWPGTKYPEHTFIWSHGWFGSFDNFAEQAKPEFMREFSHIMYDRPGSDRESERIIDEPDYDPAEHFCMNIAALEQMMDEEIEKGREKFTLVGHSMGGIVLQSFADYCAEYRPDLHERINALVLVNTSKEEAVSVGSFLDRFPGAGIGVKYGVEAGARAWSAASKIHRAIRRAEPAEVEEADEEMTEQAKDYVSTALTIGYFDTMLGGDAKREVYLAAKGRAKQNSAGAMVYDGRAMEHVPKRRSLGKVDTPVFVFSSGKDGLLPDTGHGVAAQFAKLNPKNHRTREFYLEDEGHCIPMTAPRWFNSLMHRIGEDPQAVLDRFGTTAAYRLKAVRPTD